MSDDGRGGQRQTGASSDADFLEVRRSGGVTGTVRSGQVDLATDPRGEQLRDLLNRTDLTALQPSPPQPDRFVYSLRYGEHEVRVGERDLTGDLHQLVRIVLDSSD